MIKFQATIYNQKDEQVKLIEGTINEIKNELERTFCEYPSFSWGMLRCSSFPSDLFIVGHRSLNQSDIEEYTSIERIKRAIKVRQHDLSARRDFLTRELTRCIDQEHALYQALIDI